MDGRNKTQNGGRGSSRAFQRQRDVKPDRLTSGQSQDTYNSPSERRSSRTASNATFQRKSFKPERSPTRRSLDQEEDMKSNRPNSDRAQLMAGTGSDQVSLEKSSFSKLQGRRRVPNEGTIQEMPTRHLFKNFRRHADLSSSQSSNPLALQSQSQIKGPRHSRGSNQDIQRSAQRSSESIDIPLSIPYTTPASEFLYGTSVVLAALSSGRRKLYKLYISDSDKRENLARDTTIRKLARKAGVEVVYALGDMARLMDKMSRGRPHNVSLHCWLACLNSMHAGTDTRNHLLGLHPRSIPIAQTSCHQLGAPYQSSANVLRFHRSPVQGGARYKRIRECNSLRWGNFPISSYSDARWDCECFIRLLGMR